MRTKYASFRFILIIFFNEIAINSSKFSSKFRASFVDKFKHLKKNIAANFETVSHRVSESINHDQLEDFHEFLRAYTDIFAKHIYATKCFTYKNLKNIVKDENIAVLSGDKDSSIAIMQKGDYNQKLQQMIDEGIRNGIYTPTEDNTLNDLRKFQEFLRRNFNDKFARYDDVRPVSNQPGRIYATAKTHRFNSLDDINIFSDRNLHLQCC